MAIRQSKENFRSSILRSGMAIVAVGGTTLALVMQIGELRLRQREAEFSRVAIERALLEQREEVQKALEPVIQREVSTELNKRLSTIKSVGGSDGLTDIEEFKGRLSAVEESTKALRQAIDPLHPEEVLTIARLGDRLAVIDKQTENFEGTLKTDLKDFQDAVRRELDASDRATTLILVVLVPLVLNFLYTVWQDRRREKEEKAKEERTPKPTPPTSNATGT